jgi:hypothetical protein
MSDIGYLKLFDAGNKKYEKIISLGTWFCHFFFVFLKKTKKYLLQILH